MGKAMQGVAWGAGVLLVAGLAVAVLAPDGTSMKSSSSSSGGPVSGGPVSAGRGGAPGIVAPQPAASSAAVSNSGVAAAAPASVGPAAAAAPVVPADTVVRTGSLDIEVGKGDFTSAFSAAATVARDEGGFVVTAEMGPAGQPGPIATVPAGIPDGITSVGPTEGTSQGDGTTTPTSIPGPTSISGGAAPTSGTLELRIPSSKFDDARLRLEALGSLRAEQLSGQDAGGQLSDLSARLADLGAEQDGLRAMAAKASSSDTILQIETQLAAVQQQIDGLTAEQATLQDQVALASLTVSIEEPAALAPPSRSILSTRVAQAGHGVEAVLGGIIVVAAYAGPIAVLLGLAGLGWAGWRRRRLVGTVS